MLSQNPQQAVESRFDPELVKQLKEEVVNDLKTRREWWDKYYGEPGEWEDYQFRPGYGYGPGYGRPAPGYGPGMGTGTGPGRYYGWCPVPPGQVPPGPMPRYYYRKTPLLDYEWWTNREAYDYQRQMSMLRNGLQRELDAVNKINQRLGQIRDPQVRQLLYDLLQEAGQQGMDVQEVMQSLNRNYSPSGNVPLASRLTGWLNNVDRRSFGWGAGAALLGILFMPSLNKTLRPLTRKAMEEAMEITERAQGVFSRAKEEFEDIVGR